MKNKKFNFRLKSLLVASIAGILIFVSISLLRVRDVNRNLFSIYNDRILPLKQLKNVSDAYNIDVIQTTQKVFDDRINIDTAISILKNAQNRINVNWSAYLQTYLTPKEQKLVEQTERLKYKADSISNLVIEKLKSGKVKQDHEQLKHLVENEVYPFIETLTQKINKLTDLQTKVAFDLKAESDNIFKKIIVLSIFVTLLILLIIWLIIRIGKINLLLYEQADDLVVYNEELTCANEEMKILTEQLAESYEQLNSHKNELELLVEQRVDELRINETRLRILIDTLPDLIWLKDSEGNYLQCNKKFETRIGKKEAEIIGKNDYDFFDKEMADLFRLEDFKAAEAGKYLISEDEIIFPDGHKETCETIKTPVYDDQKNITGVLGIARDISERKRKETELAESQIKLNTILESTSDLVWAVDSIEFKLISYNSSFKKFYQERNAKIEIGTTPDFIYNPMAVYNWINFYIKVLETGAFETEYTTWDQINVFRLSFYPLIRDNQIFGISVFGKDITEMKKTQEQLKLMKHSIDIAPDSAYWLDPAGHFIYVNETGYNRLGYSQAEFLNLVIEDVSPNTSSEGWETILKQLREKGSYLSESMHRRKDGTMFPVEITTTYIYFNGKEYINGFAKDITERKAVEEALRKSEELYRQVTMLSGYLVYNLNPDNDIIIWNGAIENLTGYKPEEYAKVGFNSWLEMVHPDDRENTLFVLNDAIQNSKTYFAEYRYKVKSGNYTWIEALGFRLPSNNVSGYKVIGVMKEITQRKRLEQQVLNSVIETEEKERLHFSQELHDGLGPLISAIKMYVELFSMPGSKMDTKMIVSNAENLIDEASRTIRDISFKISPHILQNYGLIEAIKSYIDRVKESKTIIINLNADKIPRFWEIAETIVYRVLCECINNTIRHAKANKIEIDLKILDEVLELVYSDDGCGFNVESALKKHKGIGLNNMQSRIKSIAGIMDIISNPGNGTLIRIKVKVDKI